MVTELAVAGKFVAKVFCFGCTSRAALALDRIMSGHIINK